MALVTLNVYDCDRCDRPPVALEQAAPIPPDGWDRVPGTNRLTCNLCNAELAASALPLERIKRGGAEVDRASVVSQAVEALKGKGK